MFPVQSGTSIPRRTPQYQPPTRALPPLPILGLPSPQMDRVSQEVLPDWTSVHGEEGSDWGEDEDTFEWLDTENAPEAINGQMRSIRGGTSPSKRLSKLKAVVSPRKGVHGEAKKLRKPLIFTRRAPPPPSTEHGLTQSISNPSSLRSQSTIHELPPPPPQIDHSPLKPPRPQFISRKTEPSGITDPFEPQSSSSRNSPRRPPPLSLAPKMVPLRDPTSSASHLPKSSNMNRNRSSQMSFQSVAYSFYDLGDGANTPRANTPVTGQVFPNGTYRKVSVSRLEREKELRERTSSDPGRRTPEGIRVNSTETELVNTMHDGRERTAEGYLNAGLEARGKGDLPRSAWYFRNAAEGGSVTGRMYWGESTSFN
jgi:hypothetical protein